MPKAASPTKVGVAIADVTTGLLGCVAVLAALEGRGRADSPAYESGPADRPVDLRVDPGGPRQPGPERLCHGASPGRRGNAHPEHRALRDVRHEPTARSPSRPAASASGPACAPRSGWTSWPPIRASPRMASGWPAGPSSGRSWPIGSPLGRPSSWLERLEAAESPLRPDPGRPRGARVRAGPGPGDDGRGRAPASSARSARSACHSSLAATPATIRSAPPLLGEHSAEILAELG